MVIDEKFVESFANQIEVLKKLQRAVQDAIDRANQRYEKLKDPKNFGKKYEDVIALDDSKQSPAEVAGITRIKSKSEPRADFSGAMRPITSLRARQQDVELSTLAVPGCSSAFDEFA
jgi:hypothetical protein